MTRHHLAHAAAAAAVTLALASCSVPGSTTVPTDNGVDAPTSAKPAAKGTAAPAPAKPDKLTAHKVGEVVNIGSSDGTKVQVSVAETRVSKHPTTAGFGDPPKHGFFHFVTVKIRNIGTKPYSYNPLYFQLSDPDGNRAESFDGNAMMAGGDNNLGSGDLAPGDVTRGELVFDAKANSTTLRLNDSGLSSTAVAIWTVK